LSTESVFDFYFDLIKGKSKKTGEKERKKRIVRRSILSFAIIPTMHENRDFDSC
jgi:hypothetical protein